jgi:hypothetical protein
MPVQDLPNEKDNRCRSAQYRGLSRADLVHQLFRNLGWRLEKFRWSDGFGTDKNVISHFLAFEAAGRDPPGHAWKPWFMICISKDILKPEDLSKKINLSWNMDFPVLVVLERESLLVFDCTGKYMGGEPAPDISLDISDSEKLERCLYAQFSLSEPDRSGFWRRIARRYDCSDGLLKESVETSLYQSLESWRGVLKRRIQSACPLISPDELDSCVLKAILWLFWDKTTRERNAGPELSEITQYRWRDLPEGSSFPFPSGNGSSPDFYLLKREIEERRLLDTDFFFSLIPFPRIVSAFHQLLKVKLRPETAGISLPPGTAVDYCLDQAVRWQESHSYERMTVLDPVCGCGLFLSRLPLILALQGINGKEVVHDKKEEFPVPEELTLPCRPDFAFFHPNRILSRDEALGMVQGLYGADPDPLAVDVCRCILALTFLEMTGESEWRKISGKIAETLLWNIVPGDILIGTDFASVVGWKFPGRHPREGMDNEGISGLLENMTEWKNFGVITGFFDISGTRMPKIHRHYLQTRYSVYHRDSVPASCLIERALELLSSGGACFLILPGGWLRSNAFRAMRGLLSKKQILSIIDLSFLFTKPMEDSHYSILAASPSPPCGDVMIARVRTPLYTSLTSPIRKRLSSMPQEMLGPGGWSLVDRRLARLEKKIRCGRPSLEEYVMGLMYPGDFPDDEYGSLLSRKQVENLQRTNPREAILLHPFISGESVLRYGALKAARFLPINPVFSHSDPDNLFYSPSDKGPKLVIGTGRESISCTFYDGGFLAGTGVLMVPGEDHFLLGILNSRLISFFIARLLFHHPTTSIRSLVPRLPIHVVDLADRDEQTLYNRIVSAVKRIISLHELLGNEGGGGESEIRASITEMDLEIDRLCFRLYDLSEEEIQIILSYSENSARTGQ